MQENANYIYARDIAYLYVGAFFCEGTSDVVVFFYIHWLAKHVGSH